MKQSAEALRKVGLILTPQRLAVYRYLRDCHDHPSAEEVYREVKRDYPSLSRTTVYAALEALCRAGAIQQLFIRHDRCSFDPNPTGHSHFLCRRCHRILDVDEHHPPADAGSIEGHRVESVQHYYYGVCRECLAEDESDEEET